MFGAPQKRSVLIIKNFLVGVMAVAVFAPRSSAADGLTDNDKAVIEWFGQLGYEDYASLPLVKVTTGWWSQTLGGEAPANQDIHAFLIQESKTDFVVYTFGLQKQTFKKSAPQTAKHKIVRFDKTDLAAYVQVVLAEHAARQNQSFLDRDSWRRFGQQSSEAVEFLVLANACVAQGHESLAHSLLVAAKQLTDQSRDARAKKLSLKDSLANDLAHTLMWRTIAKFGDPEIPRQSILKDLESLISRFPQSPHLPRAKSTAKILTQMITEDQSHDVPADFDKLSVEQRVSDLIFRLRDQNGVQFMQPGSCDIFVGDNIARALDDDPNSQRKLSPAGQLVDIGHDAVPQLIDTWGDERFSRSVGYHRNFYFSHHVLTVGQCAQRTLGKIAGRHFEGKAEAEKWWQDMAEKGEQQVLIEATKRGDSYSPPQAKKLAQQYPDIALDAITKGTKHSQSTWVRNSLQRLAADFGDTATPFLVHEMKRAPKLESRVSAAALLPDDKQAVAVKTMIVEWQKLAEGKRADPTDIHSIFNGSADGVEALIEFLATCNNELAVKSLHDRFGNRSAKVRLCIVSAFGTKGSSWSMSSTGFGPGLRVPDQPIEASAVASSAIESLLIHAMGDTEKREGLSGSWGSYQFSSPRICDMAGHVLAGFLPAKYTFDGNGLLDQREQQRIAAINIWRKEHGQQSLPAYQPWRIEPLPKATTQPILKKIIAAKNDADRAGPVRSLAELGVGCLPAIDTAINELSVDHPAKEALRKVASQLACTVTKINLSADGVKVDAEFLKRISAFENQQLQSEPLAQLLAAVASRQPDGSYGLKINILRQRAETGIVLNVTFATNPIPRSGTQQMWKTSTMFILGGKNTSSSSGGFSLETAKDVESYTGFTNIIETALKSTPDQTFDINYSMIIND